MLGRVSETELILRRPTLSPNVLDGSRAVDLGSGDPYDDGFVVSQKGKGMGKRFRQTRVSKAFQAVSVPCTAKIESAPMPEIEYESD